MKKLFVTCALIIGATLIIAPGTASAQATGSVDVDITVDGFVILYYYDEISINISSDVMAQALTGSTALGVGSASGSIDATVSGPGTLNAVGSPLDGGSWTTAQTLTIQNAWSIRGLVNSGSTVTVAVNAPAATMAGAGGPGSGTIGVTGGACSGTCLNLTPSLGTVLSGNVDLNLNFNNVDQADTFSSSPTYTITASIV